MKIAILVVIFVCSFDLFAQQTNQLTTTQSKYPAYKPKPNKPIQIMNLAPSAYLSQKANLDLKIRIEPDARNRWLLIELEGPVGRVAIDDLDGDYEAAYPFVFFTPNLSEGVYQVTIATYDGHPRDKGKVLNRIQHRFSVGHINVTDDMFKIFDVEATGFSSERLPGGRDFRDR